MAEKTYSPKEAALAVLKKAEELYNNSSLSKAEHKSKKDLKKWMSPGPAATAPAPSPTPSPQGQTLGSKIGYPGADQTAPMGKNEEPLEKKYVGFKAVEESARKSGASDPAAVAAAVGRKKYGKEAFQHAAAKGKKMHKSDEEGHNPDADADAELGEKVEQDVQEHEQHNADPVHQEPQMKGHIKLAKFMGRMEHKKEMKAKEMGKSEGEESKHDRCVEDVKENSPKVENPHAVCVSEGVKPSKWSK